MQTNWSFNPLVPIPESSAARRAAAWFTAWDFAPGLVVSLLLGLTALLTVRSLAPPAVVPSTASPVEFSAGRALKHLEAFNQGAHPIGSSAQAAVRQSILDELASLGLQAEVQATTAATSQGRTATAGTVQNIVARMGGTASTGAILLMAHYDSTTTGPGASTAGAGVASLLETARALKWLPPLKNDVIFLFTDGAETCGCGTAAFIQAHPWARHVALALDFDAVGTTGPALVYETSGRSGALTEGLTTAAPDAVASSLLSALVSRLSPSNDFAAIKATGLSGLHIAFAGGHARAGTALDNPANLDQQSLQHQGEYALGLTRRLGSLNLADVEEPAAVFFTTLDGGFVHYSTAQARTLAIIVTALFAVVGVLGFFRRRLSAGGMAWGFLWLLDSLILSAFVVTLAWWAIRSLDSRHLEPLLPQIGDTYGSSLYLVSIVALCIATAGILYAYLHRRIRMTNLAFGALSFWLVLMLISSLFFPAASYLFTWPLLLTVLGWGVLFITSGWNAEGWETVAALALGAIMGVALLAGLAYELYQVSALQYPMLLAIPIALLMGLLIPYVSLLSIPSRWLLPSSALLVAAAGLALAGSTARFDAAHPKPDSLFYALNADNGEAVWASLDSKADGWTSQFLTKTADRTSIAPYHPLLALTNPWVLQDKAPVMPLPRPNIQVLDDTTSDAARRVHLRITSSRVPLNTVLQVVSPLEVTDAVVNGKRLEAGAQAGKRARTTPWMLQYWAPPADGLDVLLEIDPKSPLQLRVVQQYDGLPDIPWQSARHRPQDTVQQASVAGVGESTLVSQSFTIRQGVPSAPGPAGQPGLPAEPAQPDQPSPATQASQVSQ